MDDIFDAPTTDMKPLLANSFAREEQQTQESHGARGAWDDSSAPESKVLPLVTIVGGEGATGAPYVMAEPGAAAAGAKVAADGARGALEGVGAAAEGSTHATDSANGDGKPSKDPKEIDRDNKDDSGKAGDKNVYDGNQVEDALKYARENNLPVVVLYGADWCGPCKIFKPTWEQAASDYKGKAVFISIDADAVHEGKYSPEAMTVINGIINSAKGIPTVFAGRVDADGKLQATKLGRAGELPAHLNKVTRK